jgi:DNA-binding CsgD family transcriptional regulator
MTTCIQLEKTATFLGRGQQVGRIDAQLGALASGQGSVVLVSGGFGMGKTALLTQATRMAGPRGIRVFHGAGDPATQAVPLAPLLEALMVQADAPMLIVIDDLQWADAVSLLFLTLLSRRSAATGILWLLAFRPGELSAAGRVAVDRLATAGAVSLAVDPLDEHAVEDIAARLPEHDWAELTAAEIPVARLAARGESNRTIAEHLFLSPHTVDSHLRSIFGKLAIRSRIELAHLAAERASRSHSRPAA